MVMVRVEAPHFVAGMVVVNDKVIRTAPILHWAKGKTMQELRPYLQRKGWTVTITFEGNIVT